MKTKPALLAMSSAILLTGCRSQPAKRIPTAADLRLAERGEAAVKLAVGTPANEIANMVAYDVQSDLMPLLRGEVEGDAEKLAFARHQIAKVSEICENAHTWPRPAPFTIPRAASAPVIDGSTDEPIWQRAAIFRTLYPFDRRDAVDEPATVFRVLWDERHLYFAFECTDPDILAPDIERDGPVWEWDCVEVFLLPEFDAGLYWEIDITPGGAIYDALNAKKFKGWGGLARPELNVEGMQVGCRINGTINRSDDRDTGYVVEIALPFRQLPSYTRGNAPRPGDTLHLMLIRLDRNADGAKYYAFAPLHNWGHNIWNHAQATLAP